jgi:probable rRNA maturation factor
MITLINRTRKIPINNKWVKSTIQAILNILQYPDFDIGILLTTNRTIRHYNQTYRHKNKPTDILSFSYHPTLKPGERIITKSDEDKNLGDLILSLEYILKDAQKNGISLEDRLKILLVHGICHLLGYDHGTDADWNSMRKQEALILNKLR